jgi:uncharacterized membrane protein (TIGR02234 family)
VALLSTRQRWSEGTTTVAGGAFSLTARGSDVTGVPAALAIVGLAALVAVFAVRRAGRLLVSALLALSGAGTIAAALLGVSDTSALDDKAAQAAGDTSATVEGAEVSLGGDIVTEVAGKKVTGMDQMIEIVNEAEPGEELELELHRGDSTKTVTVTLGDRPDSVESGSQQGE